MRLNFLELFLYLNDHLLMFDCFLSLILALSDQLLVLLSELVKLCVPSLQFGKCCSIQLLSLHSLFYSHAQGRIKLITNFLGETFLLISDKFFESSVALFEVC